MENVQHTRTHAHTHTCTPAHTRIRVHARYHNPITHVPRTHEVRSRDGTRKLTHKLKKTNEVAFALTFPSTSTCTVMIITVCISM